MKKIRIRNNLTQVYIIIEDISRGLNIFSEQQAPDIK